MSASGAATAGGARRYRDGTIVVVDDSDATRYARRRTLVGAGYTVHEAASGAAALVAVAETSPDLVVLDVKLPDISGIEVCRTIKRKRPSTLVLHTSAVYVDRADRIRGLETGADAYIIEPIEAEELLANVTALFRLRKEQMAVVAGENGGAADQLRRAARSELLLKEMYHHTKNDFQMAVSLLSLQSQQSADPSLRQALGQAMDRLRAMAHVHELLYKSGTGTSVDCADLIRAVCDGLPLRARHAASNVRLSFDLEHLVCGRDRAIPLALITNEVVTNALKHAFPEGRGNIHVKLARRHDETVLTIQDDGIGNGNSKGGTGKSFGKRLVSALAQQLGGEDYVYEHGQGTVFRLRLKP